jgi:hypothetical protein
MAWLSPRIRPRIGCFARRSRSLRETCTGAFAVRFRNGRVLVLGGHVRERGRRLDGLRARAAARSRSSSVPVEYGSPPIRGPTHAMAEQVRAHDERQQE